jgi:hypothetical protein
MKKGTFLLSTIVAIFRKTAIGKAEGPLFPGNQMALPVVAPVGRFEDAPLGSTPDQLPNRAAPLVGRSVDHIRIFRIERDVADPGVRADGKDALPL